MMILYDLEYLTMVFLSEVSVYWLPGEAECTSNNICIFKLKAPGGGGTRYNGLYGEASPKRATFYRLQVYERF